MVKVGRLGLPNRVMMAPMAGVTDLAFRQLAREAGCGLVFTEMVSAKAIVMGNRKTGDILRTAPEEKPVGVQLFGSDPAAMARAAQVAVAQGASLVDVNMGCPAPKVVKNGDGAALMRNPRLAARVVGAIRSSVPVPVTVKMRKGWDDGKPDAVDVALAVCEAGAHAVTVHGRTRMQFYSGQADWEIIRRVKDAVSVPVFGNGDVFSATDAARMIDETGCDGVMIARGCLGRPWIFHQVVHFLETGELLPEPPYHERIRVALKHLDLLVGLKGEDVGVRQMRKHAGWYVRGFPGAAALRKRINTAETRDEMAAVLKSALEQP